MSKFSRQTTINLSAIALSKNSVINQIGAFVPDQEIKAGTVLEVTTKGVKVWDAKPPFAISPNPTPEIEQEQAQVNSKIATRKKQTNTQDSEKEIFVSFAIATAKKFKTDLSVSCLMMGEYRSDLVFVQDAKITKEQTILLMFSNLYARDSY